MAFRPRDSFVKVNPYPGFYGPGCDGVGVCEGGEEGMRTECCVPFAPMLMDQRLVEVVSVPQPILEDPLKLI